MIAGRYRIIGLLGRGGMGEVYRADDLKLGQPVALKFLPEAMAGDQARLTRFHSEVRISRQVAHPNVCRVYDIGEVDGQHYLTMEFVDGEDLASLLRRIGRLPQDKAIEIARQLCAGLAAAHDRGVLHRDLKPANVMIDGRGRVRITDFGLAGAAGEIRGAEARAGTPAYMSPEQLAGGEVTVQSDLYALGLVLYETFTGKPAFEPPTPAGLPRPREQKTPTKPSSITNDIDPAVERVILRCLERDPGMRPASALVAAAALPGGDPLAAALAAGETPSPEMVAAAGEVGGLKAAAGWACFLSTLLGIVLSALLAGRSSLLRRVPLDKPSEVLADRARDIIQKIGYRDRPADSSYGFGTHLSYLRYVQEKDLSPARWDRLPTGRPAAIFFYYRQSPDLLEPRNPRGTVEIDDPPLSRSGMVDAYLDMQGRLWQFSAVPLQVGEDSGSPPAPDWSVLFTEAGLDRALFTPVRSAWTPPVYADTRTAWEGSDPHQPGLPLRIEAGAYGGRPVYFQILGPWTKPRRMDPLRKTFTIRAGESIMILLYLSVLVFGLLLARQNLRLGRGDRRGAFRVAVFIFSAEMLVWLFRADHIPSVTGEWELFVSAFGRSMFASGSMWLTYVALEPHVRRRWPDTVISWSRLLTGRLRDPLVGRDILIGALLGTACRLLSQINYFAPSWLGLPPPAPLGASEDSLLGGGRLLSDLFDVVFPSVRNSMGTLFLLVTLLIALKRKWAAVGIVILVIAVPVGLERSHGYLAIDLAFGAALVALLVYTLVRFGLLASVTQFAVNDLLMRDLITLDVSAWYSGGSIVAVLVAAGLAAYGFHASRAGRALLKGPLLQE
jgi:eukaryotic-like serine/threonine-protein kinase